MHQLKGLILTSCILLIFNCTTAPSLKLQENVSTPFYLLVTGSNNSSDDNTNVDIDGGQTTYSNMTEETFMDLLNDSIDELSLIEGIWSSENNLYTIGIQKNKEKSAYDAFILNSMDSSTKKGEIIAEFFKTASKYIYFTEYYLEDKTKIVTKTYVDDHGILQILLKKWRKENLFFVRNNLTKETTEEEKTSFVKQSLSEKGEMGSDVYYVQVSALKNHNDAKKLLVKIKKYYHNANIVVHNNFSKIRIPGIMTKKHGTIISEDIEKKFNLKPIVVKTKQ